MAVADAVAVDALEITVSKADLLRELSATQGAVERKATIPILSNYLFEAGLDSLSITATDLDISLRTLCPAKVKREGACTVPARRLYEYVKLLPDSDIAIKMLENKWVSIRCGRSHTKMVGMSKANFPTLTAFPSSGVVSIPAKVMVGLIERVAFAISSEESRYTLNGALMILKADSITMVATDGHRLSHCQHAATLGAVSGEIKTLVPKKCMDELKSLLDSTEAENVEFAKDDNTLFFRIGSRLLTSRQLTGQFPNFEAVLPKDNNKRIPIKADTLSAAIMRVAQFADERSRAVRLRLENDELRLSASSTESGESEDTIEVTYSSDPLVVGFNATYLVDFLKVAGTTEIRMEFRDSQSAGQLCPAEGDEYKWRYIVMPMRVLTKRSL